MTEKKKFNRNFLPMLAVIVTVIGAAYSLYFMFNMGRNQKSILLIVLFTGWVLSPFVGLFIANKVYSHWKPSARVSLYWLMIILTIGSVVAYSGAFNTPQTKPASTFLIVPFIAWLLILTVTLITRRLSRK